MGAFFYTINKLNTINNQQTHRYDQLIRVEKLKELNNSYSWIVLDIITDYEKIQIVKQRLNKADDFYTSLNTKKIQIIGNSEAQEEKKNLILIFKNFAGLKAT